MHQRSRRHVLREPVVMAVVLKWVDLVFFVAQSIFEILAGVFSITESEVSVDLLNSQVPQIWMSEEVFATVRQVEERIWIVWILVLVRLLPRNTNASSWYEI